MRFAEHIRAEAQEQRRRVAAGEPIPPADRRYARRAGAGVFALCGSAALAVVMIGLIYGPLYWMVALFFAVMAGIGVVQVVTGRHLLTGRER